MTTPTRIGTAAPCHSEAKTAKEGNGRTIATIIVTLFTRFTKILRFL